MQNAVIVNDEKRQTSIKRIFGRRTVTHTDIRLHGHFPLYEVWPAAAVAHKRSYNN